MNSEIESLSIAQQEILKDDETENVKEETKVTNIIQNLQTKQKEVEEPEIKKNGIQSDFFQVLLDFTNLYEKMAQKINNIQSKLHQSGLLVGKENDENVTSTENQGKSQQLNDVQEFERQRKYVEFQLGGFNEKSKAAQAKIQKQIAQIQQLKSEIKDKEQQNQNMSYQYQSFIHCESQKVQLQIQAYEQKINELTEEKDYLERKYQSEKINNQQSLEKLNDLENEINQKEILNKKQEALVKKLQQQVESLRQEQENLELERNKAVQQGWNLNNDTQRLRQDLQKSKNDCNQLQFEREQLKIELENFKSQHTLFVNQALSSQQTTNQENEEEQKCLNNKINQLNNEINNLKKQLSNANYKIKDREAKIEDAKLEYSKLQLHLDQLNSTGISLNQENKTLEQTTQCLQDELKEAKRQYEAEKMKYRTAENEKALLLGQLYQKELELNNEKIQGEKTPYLEQLKRKAECNFNSLQQQTIYDEQRLQAQDLLAEKKIQRVIQNIGETKLYKKLNGPLEKIMASKYKINRFTENPYLQSDNVKYNLIEITLQQDKYTQYVKEGKFFLIDECFQLENKIKITAKLSIQANAESELYRGYLMRIIESTQADLKTKTFLRKDLKMQNSAYQNKEEAARLAVNNLFCQWLQLQFNKDLEIAKLQPQQQTIHRQFIIENEVEKEYYYCEMVDEGPYSKINGGKFAPQKDDIHQYFNSLSLYSYTMFEQQMILTNFQVCGNYVYDMIVHTNHKGLFSTIDKAFKNQQHFQIQLLNNQQT